MITKGRQKRKIKQYIDKSTVGSTLVNGRRDGQERVPSAGGKEEAGAKDITHSSICSRIEYTIFQAMQYVQGVMVQAT